ncbi:adenylyl-sulfate kinase [Methylobacterium pseudosasicola]|uniref:Adenylyl-sulfate kinase n=1 Tax=Methylobacterium pseudosasicola TaxID=582667 RepID=A0A1I4RKX4_9HYPH|nr:adenylyl-sulfate kinase [Methylobacterium pseudosasicola]SFM52603.1 adenylylsulfate kinase [Methylobacterium pseudosasicola]
MSSSPDAGPDRNLTWHTLQPRELRWRTLGQRPVIAWLTGLSGSGKSSIANAVDRKLTQAGRATMVLDGDNLRHGLNRDLGFTASDRIENIRRAAEAAKLMAEAGVVTIVSLISPFREERAAARVVAGDIAFLEVFVDTPLDICEARDPKGLYERARSGKIPHFTGISAPYEVPTEADLTLITAGRGIAASAQPLIKTLMQLSAPQTSQPKQARISIDSRSFSELRC